MDVVRVGYIGAGSLSNNMHYPSLYEFDDASIEAVCDINEEKLHKTADKFEVEKRFTDYREMLEKVDVDAVYVVMPPHHLFDIVIQCLNAKRAVFIEKPPGVTREQTRQMALCAERNGCLTMVGFNRRFIPLMVKVKGIVEKASPIIHCVATFQKNHIGKKAYYDGAVDILTCDAVHAVDALRWMGGDVKAVASDVNSFYMDFPNSFNAVMKFEKGASGLLNTNWAVGGRVHTFEMHAKGISSFIDPDDKAVIYRDGAQEGEEITAIEAAGSEERHKYYGFFGENRHFIDCVKAKENPVTNFADATKTMELVERIYSSQIG